MIRLSFLAGCILAVTIAGDLFLIYRHVPEVRGWIVRNEAGKWVQVPDGQERPEKDWWRVLVYAAAVLITGFFLASIAASMP